MPERDERVFSPWAAPPRPPFDRALAERPSAWAQVSRDGPRQNTIGIAIDRCDVVRDVVRNRFEIACVVRRWKVIVMLRSCAG